jgi:hypothetical protein
MSFKEGVYRVSVSGKNTSAHLKGSFEEVANQFWLIQEENEGAEYTVYGGKEETKPGSEIPTLIRPQVDSETQKKMLKDAEIDPVVKAQVTLARMLGMFRSTQSS